MILTRRILGPAMAAPHWLEARRDVSCVMIRDGHAYGADGFALVRIALEGASADMNLPVKPVRAVANLLRGPHPLEEDRRHEGDEEVEATLGEDGRLHMALDGVDYAFATTRKAIDPVPVWEKSVAGDPVATIRVDIERLKRLVDALIVAGLGETGLVDLEFRGERVALALRGEDSDGGKVDGLLMPIDRRRMSEGKES